MPVIPPSRDTARELDAADPLAAFRREFVVAHPDLVYLDGNSLGRLPVRTRARLADVVETEWGERLIRGWGEGWFTAPARIGAKIAATVGAEADEIVVADSTTVNFFKLVVGALGARPDRTTIVTDDANFPSDLYVLQGVVELLGGRHRIHVVHTDGCDVSGENALLAAIDDRTALVTVSHTAFKSGFVYDMARVASHARAAGALTLWDLSHSVGSGPVALDASEADLAVGCTYKYLNGGPGAPAFIYVARRLHEVVSNPIRGWFGQRRQFDFSLEYEPAAGIGRFLSGTPQTLSLLAVEPAIDLVLEAGLAAIRAKAVLQTEFLIALHDARLAPLGFTLNSPRESARRGSHVSIGHAEGWRINRALIEEMKVLPDFRQPDNIRLGIAPLYTSFVDIFEAVERLGRVVTERRYERYSSDRLEVT
ncbi:MAG: kynureninase [Vicinamibacterales bacterium]